MGVFGVFASAITSSFRTKYFPGIGDPYSSVSVSGSEAFFLDARLLPIGDASGNNSWFIAFLEFPVVRFPFDLSPGLLMLVAVQ